MLYLVSILVLIGLDQWTKRLAVANLIGKGSIEWIPSLLGFRYAENTGAAFSILRDRQLLLILLTFVILAGMTGYMIKAIRTEAHIIARVSYVFIMAGAIGNFIDRVRFNYVIDFLEFRFIQFPIFNIADVCVVVGVALLSYATLFLKYEF